MTRVAVDALGGDRAPEEVVAGALEAASPTIQPILFGPAGLDTGGLELVETTQFLEMDDKPAEAVRAKPDSSLVAACRAVGEKRADAVVSAGNTGAMLAASFLELRRLPGVARPAIAVVDADQARPVGPARLGRQRRCAPRAPPAVRAHGDRVRAGDPGLPSPEVRLLSIGEEPEKGNQLTLDAHALLAAADGLNFAGNTESRDLILGAADVVVCDGFTGNVALSLMEGTIPKGVLDALREEINGELARQGRRAARPAGRAAPPRPARPGDLRRRVPARAAGPRRDRPRQLVAARDRERDQARGARSRARHRRKARAAPARKEC